MTANDVRRAPRGGEVERSRKSLRVAVLINFVAPYRAALFDRLSRTWDLHIVWTGWEDNRVGWEHDYADRPWSMHRAWGWVWRRNRKRQTDRAGSETFTTDYIHVTPGIWPALRRLSPDVIVTWEMGFRTIMALAFGRAAGVPVWVCWESPRQLADQAGTARRRLRRWIVKRASGWISFSLSASDYLRAMGVDPERIVQVQNTVDEVPFKAAREAVRSDRMAERPRLLFVGQMVGRKGVEPLLESAARVTEEVPFELWLVGDGPERERLEDKAASLGLSSARFLGAKASGELPEIFAHADALLVPSFEEVWGLVVNEAVFAGIPVAASVHVGSADELLAESVRFDPADPDDFDRVLLDAIEGRLPRPDRGRAMSLDDVAALLTEQVVA